MKKILFIYNPKSGKGKISRYVGDISAYFESQGCQVDTHCTCAALDGQNVACARAGDYDLLVCSGGDGTLSEIVSGVMESGRNIPIGFIPTGSTNDTRPGFGIPKKDIMGAARLCLEGVPYQVDVGKFNNEYFTYVASLGSLSAVSCFTPQKLKSIMGHSAYIVEGIKELIKMDSYNMQICFDDQVIEGDFFLGLVTNSLQVGGFQGITGAHVDLQDGMFEVCLVKRPSKVGDLGKEVDKLFIHNRDEIQLENDVVIRFKTNKVVFRSDAPVQWVRDGENGGKHNEAAIEVCPKAVTIMSSPASV